MDSILDCKIDGVSWRTTEADFEIYRRALFSKHSKWRKMDWEHISDKREAVTPTQLTDLSNLSSWTFRDLFPFGVEGQHERTPSGFQPLFFLPAPVQGFHPIAPLLTKLTIFGLEGSQIEQQGLMAMLRHSPGLRELCLFSQGHSSWRYRNKIQDTVPDFEVTPTDVFILAKLEILKIKDFIANALPMVLFCCVRAPTLTSLKLVTETVGGFYAVHRYGPKFLAESKQLRNMSITSTVDERERWRCEKQWGPGQIRLIRALRTVKKLDLKLDTLVPAVDSLSLVHILTKEPRYCTKLEVLRLHITGGTYIWGVLQHLRALRIRCKNKNIRLIIVVEDADSARLLWKEDAFGRWWSEGWLGIVRGDLEASDFEEGSLSDDD